MSAATLFTARADGLPLAAALAAFAAGAEPPALVYAPGWCGFAVVRGGRLVCAVGTEPVNPYEVRAFTPDAKLRWLKDARTGAPLAAVVVSDKLLSLDGVTGACTRSGRRHERSRLAPVGVLVFLGR